MWGRMLKLLLAVGPLAAPVVAQAQGFGAATLATRDELLIGESLDAARPGYVYVYRRDGSGAWQRAGRLEASDATPNDHFGRTLALAEGDLLVGATVARLSGALYIFQRDAVSRHSPPASRSGARWSTG